MVLILDPMEELLSLTNNEIKFTDKVVITSLQNLYKKLLEIPDHLFSSIDKIILVNTLGTTLQITPELIQRLNKSFETKKLPSKITSSISKTTTIFNLITQEDFSHFINVVLRKYNQSKFIFFDSLLTPIMPSFLHACKQVYGYRKIIKNSQNDWEKIESVDKYLACGMILFFRLFNDNELDIELVTHSKPYQNSVIKEIINDIRAGETIHHLFLFKKEEYDDQKIVLLKLADEFGGFKIHDCIVNGTEMPSEAERLIVFGMDKLDDQKLHKILNDLSNKPFNKKIILIIVENYINVDKFPAIKFWLELREESAQLNAEIVLKNLQIANKILNKKISEYKFLISHLTDNVKTRLRLMKSIDELSIGDHNYYDSKKVNFWYELDSNEFNEIRNWQKPITDMIMKEGNLFRDSVTRYEITHDTVKFNWIIKINDNIVNEISYDDCIGIKYISYLHKYYQFNHISDSELRTIIDKWHGTVGRKAIKSTDAKKIRQDLTYLFTEQCPELAPLNDCLKISSKNPPGCSYKDVLGISLKISDEEIPPQI